jgi:type III pantothenate kinase
MMPARSLPLAAVDVGNSRVKVGVFEPPFAEPLPMPARVTSLAMDWSEADLAAMFPQGPGDHDWWISSVNRPAFARLTQWLASAGAATVRHIAVADLPLAVEVPHPERVGMDRLAKAVAANALRHPNRPAIVIGMGTAVVVDLVSAGGAFVGGAILPGVGTSARALHEFTDLLPLVELADPPQAVGKSSIEAIRSGLYFGTLGAVRELVRQFSTDTRPDIFLTDGSAPMFAGALADAEQPAQYVPNLTLAGIALAWAAKKGQR